MGALLLWGGMWLGGWVGGWLAGWVGGGGGVHVRALEANSALDHLHEGSLPHTWYRFLMLATTAR